MVERALVFLSPAPVGRLSTLRRISFFIAAERAAMKNHSAAKAAVAYAYRRTIIKLGIDLS